MNKRKTPSTHFSGVGYGRPPVHTRFVKGVSGNPRGRPKGRKNMLTEMAEIYFGEVPLTLANGKKTKVPRLAALLRVHMANAMKGDTKSTLLLFRLGNLFKIFDAIPKAPTLADFMSDPAYLKLLDDKQLRDHLQAIHDARDKHIAEERMKADFALKE